MVLGYRLWNPGGFTKLRESNEGWFRKMSLHMPRSSPQGCTFQGVRTFFCKLYKKLNPLDRCFTYFMLQ